MAVVFAMVASYVISRTLTPVIIRLLLRGEQARHMAGVHGPLAASTIGSTAASIVSAMAMSGCWKASCTGASSCPPLLCPSSPGRSSLSLQVGTDFFPQVDAGLIQLHVRAPARTRIEHTEQIFQSVEDKIREIVPKRDLELVWTISAFRTHL